MDENFQPKIGKNVLETLTLGMYEDSRFIFREYVQNAADQIDIAIEIGILNNRNEGLIKIDIDKSARKITVEDNATGIESQDVLQFLGDIAKSPKDKDKRKGFRGIGRLGGLGYCEKLVFETSYLGEAVKNTVTLDAKELKKIIENRNLNIDASTVISVITNINQIAAGKDEHYFKVTLLNVTNVKLLDEESVENYLSMVAPVPFDDDFLFKDKILDYFNLNNTPIEEYKVILNDQPLYKAYDLTLLDKDKNPVSEILDVSFFNLKSGVELLSVGWFGMFDLLNKKLSLHNIDRGFRIKKSNITIGDENTLNKYFTEERFNHHFIGEIHVVGQGFVPNARRDYFNDSRTVSDFEIQLTNKFKELTNLAHINSDIHNRFREIVEYKKAAAGFQEKQSVTFYSAAEESLYRGKLEATKKKAITANQRLNSIRAKSTDNSSISVLYQNIVGESDISIKPKDTENDNRINGYQTDKLSKLSGEERKLLNEIFSIIDSTLTPRDSTKLKEKIVERYS